MTLSTCGQCALALVVGISFSFAVSACRNWSSIGTGPQIEARETGGTGADATDAARGPERRIARELAGDASEPLACGADDDCVITCRSDGSCCLEQCGCSHPMSRAFLARLESHLAEACGPDPLCPVAGCVGTKRYAPRCDNGRCTARKLPGGV
jgi:hypothetical protein